MRSGLGSDTQEYVAATDSVRFRDDETGTV
jgi:hypothetical protein